MTDTVTIQLDLNSVESYKTFLAVKSLPRYRFVGRTAIIPAEYASRLGIGAPEVVSGEYKPIPGLFDYQRDISALCIRKQKFAVFARPGLGKTLIATEFARHVKNLLGPTRRVLFVSPLMVIRQTISEVKRFYHNQGIDDLVFEQVKTADLPRWTTEPGSTIGITNYEALTDKVPQGRIGTLICDESAVMKSAYGKWGQQLLRLGAGIDWKLCMTGTPAPNDRIEYATHSVFLDAFPTINSFLAKFFVNRGQTSERWIMKAHAVEAFYRSLSDWCIFLSNPATFGWKDNVGTIPPIQIHIHDVDLTSEQKALIGQNLGTLFACDVGGITKRSTLSQIAKGHHNGKRVDTNKPAFIKALIDSWPNESTLVWCRYNPEQQLLERTFPGAASIEGSTPYEQRAAMIEDFKSGKQRILISKPSVLGLGLNLQIATRQVFSSCEDSYEDFVQAIMRSNRVGSTIPLNVHVPITDAESPMLHNVLRKAKRVDDDMRIQEELFKRNSLAL